MSEWSDGLRDGWARARIVARLDRLSVGEGVSVLCIDYRLDYRVQHGQDGETLILLICGGDKRAQAAQTWIAPPSLREAAVFGVLERTDLEPACVAPRK